METPDFIFNRFGAKVLLKYTESYRTYSTESANLELFLIYLLFATHPNKDSIKTYIADSISDNDNEYVKKFVSKMRSEMGDKIFDVNNYEVYFSQMAYSRLADNALCYFKDILSEVVLKKPEILKSGEKESLDYILSFPDMESLLIALSEKKIKQLSYGKFIDLKKFFSEKLGIELFEDLLVEKNFIRFIKQRNLIVHNRGIITQEFLDEFNDDTFTVGHSLYFKFENLSNVNKLIGNVISDIDLKIREKFKLEIVSEN